MRIFPGLLTLLLGGLAAPGDAPQPEGEPARIRTRTCGGCTACCSTLANTELEPVKPTYTPCPHQCDSGCGIQDNKPLGCQKFSCLWLHDNGKMFDDSERPDILGVVPVAEVTNLGPTIRVWECHEGALGGRRVEALIRRWAKGIAVVGITFGSGNRKLWGPPDVIQKARELGAVRD